MSFNIIKQALGKQFQSMIDTGLFRINVAGDLLWSTYMGKRFVYSNR